MFSGIIEKIGKISGIEKNSDGARLSVSVDSFLDDVKLGDSIALDGACITVVSFDTSKFESDLSNETLNKTTLANLKVGDECNLEKALHLNERIGGHLVSGHIDGVGIVESIEKDGESFWFKIKANKQIMKYVVYKGSVAVDGISLTIAECDEDSFSVAIIPHTLECTTLNNKEVDSKVNLEVDMIGKYVEKLVSPYTDLKE
ncbi:MAG: riboflavin synthase [Nitrospinota bacterium]|nr:riboflavin synthase [Nitrospinota bacterium]